jgi:anaerobic nitric oxide reductase flavorubredoxin
VAAKLVAVRASDLTEVATEALDAACIAFGSSTLNQMPMPMAAAAMTYLQGLRPAGKSGFAFGSYGWGKGAPEAIEEGLKAMKVELLREPLRSQYRPTPEILDECRDAGRMLGRKAVEAAAGAYSVLECKACPLEGD